MQGGKQFYCARVAADEAKQQHWGSAVQEQWAVLLKLLTLHAPASCCTCHRVRCRGTPPLWPGPCSLWCTGWRSASHHPHSRDRTSCRDKARWQASAQEELSCAWVLRLLLSQLLYGLLLLLSCIVSATSAAQGSNVATYHWAESLKRHCVASLVSYLLLTCRSQ
jgi:hypothetical protein